MRYKRVQKLKSLFKKEESQFDFSIDRTDYFFYQALVFYCEENNIP